MWDSRNLFSFLNIWVYIHGHLDSKRNIVISISFDWIYDLYCRVFGHKFLKRESMGFYASFYDNGMRHCKTCREIKYIKE